MGEEETDALYVQLEALDFFPPKGKVLGKEEEEEAGIGIDHDFSQEKKQKKQKQKQKQKKQKKEVCYDADSEEVSSRKRKRPPLKVVIPSPPSPLVTEPPSPKRQTTSAKIATMIQSLNFDRHDEVTEVEIIDCGVSAPAIPKAKPKPKPKAKSKKKKRDLWKVKRDQILKIRQDQEAARDVLRALPSAPEEGPRCYYLNRLGARMDVIRHALLVEEIVSLAKTMCVKMCDGCRADTLADHIPICSENPAILMQTHVEGFIEGLFSRNKAGDYCIDARFAMLVDAMVPVGIDIREAFSFPTYVLQQYFMRLNNPRGIAALKKLGLDLPLNADRRHGIDLTGVMPTMLSVLCAKMCLTPVASLLGWD